LDEYERWTGDRALVRELEVEARAALNWIEEYADLRGTGYVWYERRNRKTGLENQCWKDSWDSISFRDGRLPGFPRATCELQGYAYDAKLRGARLARLVWKDPAFADRLEKEAADLKRRFNRDFWVEDGEYFALALDPDGKQVDALASNNGHLLWSGIVDKSKSKAVARHLLGPRLFSGWGVRTLAEGEGRYNPIGYHVGTVWPFDNSFIAWGLRRYGFKEDAAVIAAGILDAAEFFDGPVPDGLQPAGVVDRDAAPALADDARSRAAWRKPGGRRGASQRHRPSGAAGHPWTMGSDRRFRTRARRHESTAGTMTKTSVVPRRKEAAEGSYRPWPSATSWSATEWKSVRQLP
jgi:glycogen debranching enzyme